MLRHKLRQALIGTKRLRPFARVLVVDSSSWDVRAQLRAVLPGSGGNASTANCKIQRAYEYKTGELRFLAATAGTVSDNRYTNTLPDLLNPQDLLVIDQGYFTLQIFRAIMAQEAYFLTR